MPIALKRLFLLAAILLTAVAARAADKSQIWYLSTREAARCDPLDNTADAVRYWRMKDDCTWTAADPKDFPAGGPKSMPTVIFVPGNQTDADEAVEKGLLAQQAIAAESEGKPFRFAIWSWPADRLYRRHRPDAQLKVDYCDVESYYLASWLRSVQRRGNVSLIGHSFGPRIIAGALHLLAGGELGCRTLPPDADKKPTEPMKFRAVLMAAAADADSLAPSGINGKALPLLDKALITTNGCDRVLKWYPYLYGRGGPQAIGYTGPCCLEEPQKISLVDVSGSVGKTHDYQCYCNAVTGCGCWAHYTFLDEPTATERPRSQ